MTLQNTIITGIVGIQTVSRVKVETTQITNRKWYGLSFCLDGQLTYHHKRQAYVSAPGFAVLLPKGQSYTIQTDRAGYFPLINFQCEGLPIDSITVIPLQNSEPYLTDFESMKQLFSLPYSKLRMLELFYGILNRLSADLDAEAAMLSPVMRYLEGHIGDPALSNSILAKLAGFSEVHFRKQFTRLYGIPPHRYILELRIRRAKQLLSDGILSVSAVAEQCGFSSVYHFSRAFKSRTGVSPSEYTRKNRLNKL